MSVLALAPPHYFVRSGDVALLYLLVAVLPHVVALLLRSSSTIQARIRFRVILAYATILVWISPGLVRLADSHGVVQQWIFECAVIASVSSLATIVAARRRQKKIHQNSAE